MAHELRSVREQLGFPVWQESWVRRGVDLSTQVPNSSREPWTVDRGGHEACFATVCTLDHLHFARALAASLARTHPSVPLFVLVVDAEGEIDPSSAPGALIVGGDRIDFPPTPYLALKLDASELCCSAKPYLVGYLLRELGFSRVVYLDADQYVFSPLSELLERLDDADFVVTPHTRAPLPHPERAWERPFLGDLAAAGVLNAGLFGVRASAGALRFIAWWQELVTCVGAFARSRGLQHEQNAFNWVVAFADQVHVLRDPAYNVAYWNLHDRSLRWVDGSEDGALRGFTVDGQPLVTFHFSGYSIDEPYRLSRHDSRHSVYHHPALARLLDFYSHELETRPDDEEEPPRYRFARFGNGIVIDDRMRTLFKEHEPQLALNADPWTAEGARQYCDALMRPLHGRGSLLPLLIDSIYELRPDLQEQSPNARLDPLCVIRWFSAHGARENGYQELLDCCRPVLPTQEGVRILGRARSRNPRLFEPFAAPLGADRSLFLERLEAAGEIELADSIRDLHHEIWALSAVWVVRRLVETNQELRRSYPDMLFADARQFADWLDLCGTRTESLPEGIGHLFLRAARGRALARIFSFVNRQWTMMQMFPLAFVGMGRERFAHHLLQLLVNSPEFDCDDVVMYLWLMDECPWVGVPLTLELLYNRSRRPSSSTRTGQEELLAPVLPLDPRFRQALERHRREENRGRRNETNGSPAGGPSVYETLSARTSRNGGRTVAAAAANGHALNGDGDGINLFGFFKSPIGLGNLSRGLSHALAKNGCYARENVLGNLAMDDDLEIGDLISRFDPALRTNVFVSYPHLEDHLLRFFPQEMVGGGRRNIAYLAWELNESNPLWRDVYASYQQVWALSRFAAKSLAAALEREVAAVPCCLDVSGFPPASTKERLGIDPDRKVFLYVFDANSSIERKNPEAVVRAFQQAFRCDDRATLLLRVSNAGRSEHLARLRRLSRLAAESRLDVRFITDGMSKNDLLQLISAVDCYVSLHRAEGFGFTCAEAMAYGKPTIATGYSGNLEFMDADNSLLVDYVEAEVQTPEGPFRRGSLWAEPRIDHAATLMRRVYEEPNAMRALGERARAAVRKSLSPQQIGAQVVGLLRAGA